MLILTSYSGRRVSIVSEWTSDHQWKIQVTEQTIEAHKQTSYCNTARNVSL